MSVYFPVAMFFPNFVKSVHSEMKQGYADSINVICIASGLLNILELIKKAVYITNINNLSNY